MYMALLLLGFTLPFPFGSISGQAAKKANASPACLRRTGNVFSSIVSIGDKVFSHSSQQLNRFTYSLGFGQVWQTCLPPLCSPDLLYESNTLMVFWCVLSHHLQHLNRMTPNTSVQRKKKRYNCIKLIPSF